MTENLIEMPKTCRLCLKELEIGKDLLLNKDLCCVVETIFNIQVNSHLNYPTSICSSCEKEIIVFNVYYMQVITNQDILKNMYLKQVLEVDVKKSEVKDEWGDNDRSPHLSDSCDKITEKVDDTKHDETVTLPSKKCFKTTRLNHDQKICEFFSLKCTLCSDYDMFTSFKELQDHYSLLHKTRGYVDCCDKKFYRKEHLIDHITNHINPSAHMCPECGKMSKTKNSLKVHMKRHLPPEDRSYQCCVCPARYATKTLLTKHELSHLSVSEKKFKCDECGKAFASKSILGKHKLIHSSEHKFVCENCGRLFNSKGNLQLHMNNMHSDGQPKLQCHICQSWFKNNDTLRKHIRHHNEQHDYKCDQCDKVFSSKNLLWCHVRYVHTQIRKYSCTICERTFRRKLELTEHMARHAGKSLYECQKCTKSFMYSSHFSQHRKNCQGIGAIQDN